MRQKTYNTRCSLVVTDTITSLAPTGLLMGEQTGSRIFQLVYTSFEAQSTGRHYPHTLHANKGGGVDPRKGSLT